MCCSALPCDLPGLCSGKQERKLRKWPTFTHTNRDTHTHTRLPSRHSFCAPDWLKFLSSCCCISPSFTVSESFSITDLSIPLSLFCWCFVLHSPSSSFALTFLLIHLSPSACHIFSSSALTFIPVTPAPFSFLTSPPHPLLLRH